MPVVSGSVSFSRSPSPDGRATDFVFFWTANSSGDAEYLCEADERISGVVWELLTIPGPNAPTDNYAVKLFDANRIDVLNGLGANRDTAEAESVLIVAGATSSGTFAPRTEMNNPYRLKVSAAGNAKGGTVIVRCMDAQTVANELRR